MHGDFGLGRRLLPRLGSHKRSVAFGRNFVAGGCERAGAAPTPDEDDVFGARIVKAVPVAARRKNYVALAGRLASGIRVDKTLSLDDDEKFIHVGMAVLVVARAGWKNGPADEKFVRAGGFLIDEELDLHVDPAFVARESADSRNIFQIGAVGFHFNIPPRRR